MSAPQLVLASTSRYRRALLERLALPFTTFAPHVDERALEARDPAATSEALALSLARAKAAAIAPLAPAAHILASDQIVDLDGERLHKPGSRAAAIDQLLRLSGRAHRIVTAVTLRAPDGREQDHVDVHVMRMRALHRDALAAYVDRDDPVDCAGSYKIESAGYFLFESMTGTDHTGVIGLPLLAVLAMLERAGFAVPPLAPAQPAH